MHGPYDQPTLTGIAHARRSLSEVKHAKQLWQDM